MNDGKRQRKLRLARRAIGLAVLLPVVYVGTVSAAFYYRVHRSAHVWQGSLPTATVPTPRSRILIISPHCDDETLGCGGLIQKAILAGSAVFVAMMTNGDGFRQSAAWEARQARVTPDDYLRLADTRRNEASAAVATLGLDPERIFFLNYPDRGLQSMWNTNWKLPYLSPQTGRDTAARPSAVRETIEYTGANVLEDLTEIVRRVRPTDIYVTHPMDDHPDHATAAIFANAALLKLAHETNDATGSPRLHTYLVHRGDWPLPQGYHPHEDLLPPLNLYKVDSTATRLPLTFDQIQSKHNALAAYQTQVPLLGRFLNSFVRRNELFFTPRLETAAPRKSIQLDRSQDWQGIPAIIADPTDDDIHRHIDPGVDLRSVTVAYDRANLYVRLVMRGRPRVPADYRLVVRGFDDRFVRSRAEVVSAKSWNGKTSSGVRGKYNRDHWVLAIPLSLIGHPAHAAIYAESRRMGAASDRTACAFIKLND